MFHRADEIFIVHMLRGTSVLLLDGGMERKPKTSTHHTPKVNTLRYEFLPKPRIGWLSSLASAFLIVSFSFLATIKAV